jgi:broad specificity phosphatase PhoE
MTIKFISFYFLRHGQTDVHGIHLGSKDVPLNDVGRNQALKVQKLIEKCKISAVFYSPLSRTSETMEIATRNLSCGKFLLEELRATNDHDETEKDFRLRIISGINKALEHSGPVLVVSHGDVYRTLCKILDVEYNVIKNAELVKFNYDNNVWGVKSLN